MSVPTLTEVFGPGATQDGSVLTIVKADLASVGLTASSSNTAQSLIVAVVLKAFSSLTETNRATDFPNRHVTFYYGGQDLQLQSDVNYRRDVYQMNLYKTTPLVTVDPDDY